MHPTVEEALKIYKRKVRKYLTNYVSEAKELREKYGRDYVIGLWNSENLRRFYKEKSKLENIAEGLGLSSVEDSEIWNEIRMEINKRYGFEIV